MDILHGTAHTYICTAFHWVHTLLSSSDSINFQRLKLNHKANYNRLLFEYYFVLPKCCQNMSKYCNTKEKNIYYFTKCGWTVWPADVLSCDYQNFFDGQITKFYQLWGSVKCVCRALLQNSGIICVDGVTLTGVLRSPVALKNPHFHNRFINFVKASAGVLQKKIHQEYSLQTFFSILNKIRIY